MTVGSQSWFVAPWSGSSPFKDGANFADWQHGSIWNEQYFADMRAVGLKTFRHMDTNCTNWSKITSWSQRKLPTDPRNAEAYSDSDSPASNTGIAIELQIELCNKANVDCWFTHPYLADDDYLRQQAQLIKRQLKPNLRAYIELSNEVWNGSFSAFNQAIQAGQAGGLPGSNQWYQGIAHEMYRALQMFDIYAQVFGADQMGTRVIRLFAESGNLDLTTQAFKNVYTSSRWNPSGQKIDMLALAPYIGNGTDGAHETLARWKQEVDEKVSGEPIGQALAQKTANGIPLLGCYEGGMHHLENANVFAANPVIYAAYRYMLDRFASKMNAPCNLYTLHGNWKTGGAWGMLQSVGQSVDGAPKARAVRDWAATH